MTSRGPEVRKIVLAVLLLAGLIAVAGGGFGLYAAMTQRATAAQASAAGQQEIATRWLRLTAGQIFPRTVTYASTATKSHLSARLVGIAPRSSCLAASDPAVGTALARYGCRAMLRATYTDVSGTLVATVGVAAMPNATEAAAALPIDEASRNIGVDAAAFPGTVADLFGNPQRAQFEDQVQGPYIFFFSDGFADGRVTHAGGNDPALQDLGGAVMNELEVILNTVGDPCQEKDIRC